MSDDWSPEVANTWKPDTLSRQHYEDARNARVGTVCEEVDAETLRAMDLHASMNSAHEAYAVIQEEVEEFWEEVKKKEPSPDSMATKLRQVAAMCVRAIVDLELP